MHTEYPFGFAQILETMPTKTDIDVLEGVCTAKLRNFDEPVKRGIESVRNELHNLAPYPYGID